MNPTVLLRAGPGPSGVTGTEVWKVRGARPACRVSRSQSATLGWFGGSESGRRPAPARRRGTCSARRVGAGRAAAPGRRSQDRRSSPAVCPGWLLFTPGTVRPPSPGAFPRPGGADGVGGAEGAGGAGGTAEPADPAAVVVVPLEGGLARVRTFSLSASMLACRGRRSCSNGRRSGASPIGGWGGEPAAVAGGAVAREKKVPAGYCGWPAGEVCDDLTT